MATSPRPAAGVTSSLPPPPPPPAGAPRLRWGLGDALVAVAIYIGTAVAVAIAFVVSEGDNDALIGPWLPAFVVLPQLTVLGYVWLATDRKGRGPVADLHLRFQWIDLPIGLAISFGGLIAAGVVGEVVTRILDEDPSAAVADLVEESQEGGSAIGWIVLVAVLGATLVPLAEELLFRGLWWNAMLKRGASGPVTLIVTSLVFAAFHLEPRRAPMLLVLGLAIGYGRMWTGRLGPAIVAHATINAIAFTALVVELG